MKNTNSRIYRKYHRITTEPYLPYLTAECDMSLLDMNDNSRNVSLLSHHEDRLSWCYSRVSSSEEYPSSPLLWLAIKIIFWGIQNLYKKADSSFLRMTENRKRSHRDSILYTWAIHFDLSYVSLSTSHLTSRIHPYRAYYRYGDFLYRDDGDTCPSLKHYRELIYLSAWDRRFESLTRADRTREKYPQYKCTKLYWLG